MSEKIIRSLSLFENFLEENDIIRQLHEVVKKNHKQEISEFIDNNKLALNRYADEESLRLITKAVEDNEYTAVVNKFNKCVDSDYLLYVGPINYFSVSDKTGEEHELKLLLLERERDAKTIVDEIENYVGKIQEKLGIPCSFGNRYVEFYNLNVGPNSGNEIAIFSPFYFENYDAKCIEGKRSLMYINIMYERFKHLTLPLIQENVRFNTKKSLLLTAGQEQIKKAFIIWITLHEMFHSSGPLPLFTKNISKLNLGLDYAGIEELRVDTTAWIAVDLLPFISLSDKRLVKELIICERLLRSTRRGYWKDKKYGIIKNSSDNQQGVFWFAILQEKEGLNIINNQIHIDLLKADDILKDFLNDYYKSETFVSSEKELLELSNQMFNRYLGATDRMEVQFSPSLRNFLESVSNYTTHIKFI
ncbi:hypothetical protein P8864_07745 [Priestia flexa]|uniref:hypothetical protein n=1 Tax=Priestia flexa TaxID=86664 RepID=UPI000C24D691|nr:hypothetical protein [Priestia flexa]MEC0665825.1 hypothetical protein [Priestia flexa]